MYVIAMTNEIGTPSEAIAERISERLSIAHLVHGETHRGMVGFGSDSNADIIELADWRSRSDFDDELWALSRLMARKVLESAERGDVVIRGCGAPTILRHVDHVLRVRVCASLPTRAQAVMDLYGLDDRTVAIQIVRTADRHGAKLFDSQLGGAEASPEIHDLVLNADRLSIDQCADQVVRLADSSAYHPTPSSMAALTSASERVALPVVRF